jgi:rhodanese-related sulfurtransferase
MPDHPATSHGPPPRSARSSAELVAAARARVRELSVQQLIAAREAGAVVVDVREREELPPTGTIPGAVHVPRGVLEFVADPASPLHHPALDPARPVVLYCAVGGRSALAADSLRALGYVDLAHLAGGMQAWLASDLPTEPVGR